MARTKRGPRDLKGRTVPKRPAVLADPDFGPPIQDWEEERQIFEQRGPGAWIEGVRLRAGGHWMEKSPGEFERRISEVYRRCFIQIGADAPEKRTEIVSALAAYCPTIVLSGCPWLKLLTRSPAEIDLERLYGAMARGFRRAAARCAPSAFPHRILPTKQEAARHFRDQLATELRAEFESWPAQGRIRRKRADTYYKSLLATYTCISRSFDRDNLKEHVLQTRAREAANIIAARQFVVTDRAVRGK